MNSGSSIQNISNATIAPLASNEEVYLTSKETVVEELKKLHQSFTLLATDIRCKLDELVKSRKFSLRHIAPFIQEARVCGNKQGVDWNE